MSNNDDYTPANSSERGQQPDSQSWTSPTDPDFIPPSYTQPSPTVEPGTPSHPQPGNGYTYAPQPAQPYAQFVGRPGIIPLRPLSLGELLEGAFAAVRTNPKVMFIFPLVIMVIVSAVKSITTFALPALSSTPDMDPSSDLSYIPFFSELDSGPLSVATWVLDIIATSIVTLLITGMLSYAVSRAVIGKAPSLSATWHFTRSRIPALIGAALIVLVITVAPIAIPASLFFLQSDNAATGLSITVLIIVTTIAAIIIQVYACLSSVTVILEHAGPWQAIKRSMHLIRGYFWVTVGRLLLIRVLISIVTTIIVAIVSIPLVGLTLSHPQIGIVAVSLLSNLVSAFVLPIEASYIALHYTDIRIRREGLGDQLMAAAQGAR